MNAKSKLEQELAKVQAELAKLSKAQEEDRAEAERRARERAEAAQKVAMLKEQAEALQQRLKSWAWAEADMKTADAAEEVLHALEAAYQAVTHYHQVGTEGYGTPFFNSILPYFLQERKLKTAIDNLRRNIEAQRARAANSRANWEKLA